MNRTLINTSKDEILEKMVELAAQYTPEWKVDLDNSDVGVALMRLFADMYMDTVHLYNQVYEKNYMSFLNLYNANLMKPSSARSPVVFQASAGSSRPVLVKDGTKLRAMAENGETLGFLTEGTLEVIPGTIIHQIYADYEEDSFRTFDGETSFDLFNFDSDSEQSHELWIYHNKLFNASLPTDWHIKVFQQNGIPVDQHHLQALSNTEWATWYYPTRDGWVAFDEVLNEHGTLILSKHDKKEVRFDRNEEEVPPLHCIKCVLNKGAIPKLVDVRIDYIEMNCIKKDMGNKSDLPHIYRNDSLISITEPFKPFGERYHVADQIYIGDFENFSKVGAYIEIDFDISYDRQPMTENNPAINWKLVMKHNEITRYEPVDIILEKVQWAYWNGLSWKNLELLERGDNLFAIPAMKKRSLKFNCPEDMVMYDQLGEPRYFIRGTIDFIRNDFAANGFYMIPIIENLNIDYTYRNKMLVPEQIQSLNNGDLVDETETLKTYGKRIKPFLPLPTDQKSLFVGLSYPFGKGPSTLFFQLDEHLSDRKNYEKLEVTYLQEYRGEKRWKSIYFEDDTRGFNTSGLMTLGNVESMVEETLFGQTGYWLKFDFGKQETIQKIFEKIHINGIWTEQKEQVMGEQHYLPRNEHMIQLLNVPILSEEVWINEITQISVKEMEHVRENYEVNEVVDALGRVEAFWVKWNAIQNFQDANADERVYRIDFITGEIQFGNGRNGKEMVPASEAQVSVDYCYGGGQIGNVHKGMITTLDRSIAYIDTVKNPIDAWGGADQESVNDAMERVGQAIRHRNRAISSGDFESVIRSSARDILKVKCLSNTNALYKKEYGHVAILVMPDQPTLSLMTDQLREHLGRSINNCAVAQLQNRVHILDPIYVELVVFGRITTDKPAEGRLLYDKIVQTIDTFVDLRTGHFNGQGWAIGELPDEDMLLSVIKKIPSVQKIEGLNIFLSYSDATGPKEMRLRGASNKTCMLASKCSYKFEIISK